jgi:hypothetical protein
MYTEHCSFWHELPVWHEIARLHDDGRQEVEEEYIRCESCRLKSHVKRKLDEKYRYSSVLSFSYSTHKKIGSSRNRQRKYVCFNSTRPKYCTISSGLKEFISDQAVVYHLDIGEEEEDSDNEANEDHYTRLGQDFLQTRRQVED